MLTCPARCHVQAMPAPPIEEQNCILALIFLLVLSLVLVVSIIDFVRQFLCTGMRVRDVEMRMKTANHQGKVNLYGAWIRARGNINVSFDQGNKLIVLRVNEGVVQVCGRHLLPFIRSVI